MSDALKDPSALSAPMPPRLGASVLEQVLFKGLGTAVFCALPLLAPGCPQTCEGVGCEAQFAAGLVGVFTGSDLAGQTTLSPEEAPLEVVGELALGPDWDLVFAGSQLLVGSPVEGRVRAFAADAEGSVALLDSVAMVESERSDDAFGWSLDVVPDLNGNGVPELIVGAPRYPFTSNSRADGAVFLFLDEGAGLSGDLSTADAALRIASERDGVQYGTKVAGCGDLDGDGLGDWAASAPYDSREAELAGAVEVGFATDVGQEPKVSTGQIGISLYSTAVGARAGADITCRDNIFGSVASELIIGAPFVDGVHTAEGAVYVLEGGGPLGGGRLEERATIVLRGLSDEAWLGWSVATGDFDGDGIADIAAGAPGADSGRGEVLVWLGRTLEADQAPAPRFRITGTTKGDDTHKGDGLGRSVTTGDLDGDGISELIIGAPRRNPLVTEVSGFDSGAVYVFGGSVDAVRWRPLMSAEEADLQIATQQQYLRTGSALSTGDVDGDGLDDLALLQQTDGG